MVFKILASMLFIGALALRVFYPEFTFDTTTIALLVLALFPWLIQYIKSLEITGLGKVELVSKGQKRKLEKEAVNLEEKKSKVVAMPVKTDRLIYSLRHRDARMALAALMYELEKALIDIAMFNHIDFDPMRTSLNEYAEILFDKNLISPSEYHILGSISGILYTAVHSKSDVYEVNSYNWLFNLGLKVLENLRSTGKMAEKKAS